jgi:hypothetical protein
VDRFKNGIIREFRHGGFYIQDADEPENCYRLKSADLKKDLKEGDEVYLILAPEGRRWKNFRWAKSIAFKDPKRR